MRSSVPWTKQDCRNPNGSHGAEEEHSDLFFLGCLNHFMIIIARPHVSCFHLEMLHAQIAFRHFFAWTNDNSYSDRNRVTEQIAPA